MLNAFAKIKGLEIFGTVEQSKGRNKFETDTRKATQYAIEGIYRFTIGNKLDENFFIGARYNTVSARLADVKEVKDLTGKVTTVGINYTGDVTLNRYELAGGWFLTKNILLKGEYVNQKYKDYPTANYLSGGKFHGYVIHAVVGF